MAAARYSLTAVHEFEREMARFVNETYAPTRPTER
jgi:hypothetical protein